MYLPKYLAKQICAGFVYHDKKDYNKSIESFKNLYKSLFQITEKKAEKMAGHFVKALMLHDSVEDTYKGPAKKFFNHKIWKKVYGELFQFCKVIDLDLNYAKYYTKFLRFHSAYEKNFEIPLLRAEEILIFHKTKNMKIAKIVAPLYLSGVNSHDLHAKFTWKFNEKIMALFYALTLEVD